MFEEGNVGGIDVHAIDLPGVDELPRRADGLVPGPVFIAFLSELSVDSLPNDYDVLEWTAAWDRVATWAQAHSSRGVAEFVRRPVHIGPDDEATLHLRAPVGEMVREFGDDELAARLGASSRSMGSRINVALSLATKLPATAAAFESGRLDLVKVRAVVEACDKLDPVVAGEVECTVLDSAYSQSPSRLRQRLRRAVLSVDPARADERCKKAKADRAVWITPAEDGLAWLSALLPAADAMAIDAALEAAARRMREGLGADDHRTLAQLRADALSQPFVSALATGVLDGIEPTTLGRHRGRLPQIQVTVPMDVLLGISDAPGELRGYGPITAELAREIARDGIWRRLVTDPLSGTVLDVGRETYVPPADLQRYIEARDVTCRFPDCNRKAESCDLDHTVPYPQGPTGHGNLGPLCRRHHRFKQSDYRGPYPQQGRADIRWTPLRQREPGLFLWTMPTGHTYTVHAPAVGQIRGRPAKRRTAEFLLAASQQSAAEEAMTHALAA